MTLRTLEVTLKMARIINQDELTHILNALNSHPQSSIDELIMAMPIQINKRTLQRRLVLLESQNRIEALGNGPSRQYLAKLPTEELDLNAKDKSNSENLENDEGLINLSPESQKLCQYIHQPLIQRKPVSYQRKFLDSYQPNQSFYLPQKMRDHLFELGKTQDIQTEAGTYVRRIHERLLIDLSWNSSRLEGNTYSLLETQELLNLDYITPGKNAQETQMLLNHKHAIEFLILHASQIGFNRHTILNLHALLSDNLLGDPQASGSLRVAPVGIGKTVYHPLEIPALINEIFNQILETAAAIKDPFEQSFFSMVHLPYLQPFLDVNKRVSRLAANISLIQNNLCPLSFIDVPKQSYIDGIISVYELNRIEPLREVYGWAYQQSSARYSAIRQSIGEPDLFRLQHRELISMTLRFIIQQCLNKTLALKHIKTQSTQMDLSKRSRFIEVLEDELMSLHEGNIARYQITFPEYQQWKKGWRS